ncbi:MAG: radical SAM protein [Syntrophobacteraceae bacterium]|nr:radical SAM protein [Desulfobacteraceae bacterium]
MSSLESSRQPGYVALWESGELARRARVLAEGLEACMLCPRRCGVNRHAGKTGACGVDAEPRVAAVNIHPWEEPPIAGTRGSGTIFFSGCTLKCVFCQNYPISQMGVGRRMSVEELAESMLGLQAKGAHNINLVTAGHQAAAFVGALVHAASRGLRIPVVYNTSGFETVETLRLFEGVVDIYLPDIKYSDPEMAKRYSGRSDYVEVNRKALLEMWRQTGSLKVDENGVAWRGVLVRHLVLPAGLSGTGDCLDFLLAGMGKGVWVSLMNQYFPAYRAHEIPPLDRKTSEEEYEAAFSRMTALGIHNGFVQLTPDDDDTLPCG